MIFRETEPVSGINEADNKQPVDLKKREERFIENDKKICLQNESSNLNRKFLNFDQTVDIESLFSKLISTTRVKILLLLMLLPAEIDHLLRTDAKLKPGSSWPSHLTKGRDQ